MNIAEYLSEDNLAKVDMEPFYQVLARTETGSENFKPSFLLNILKVLPDGKKSYMQKTLVGMTKFC